VRNVREEKLFWSLTDSCADASRREEAKSRSAVWVCASSRLRAQ
jgi:hypothetical protein